MTEQASGSTWLQSARHSPGLRWAARLGLVARAGFYLLLAYLAYRVAAGQAAGSGQANANGALRAVAGTRLGALVLVAAVTGFVAFALARFAGAVGDRSVSRARRLTTAGQGCFYLGMAAVTTRFLLGDRSAGSQKQQDSTTALLLATPAGRWMLVVIGLLVVVVSAWQTYLAVQGGFTSSLRTSELGTRSRRATRYLGGLAIAARAACVAPLGALLVLAAVHDRPRQAKDFDELLVALAQVPFGRPLVLVIAGGLLLFAAYSLLEVRYREAQAGD